MDQLSERAEETPSVESKVKHVTSIKTTSDYGSPIVSIQQWLIGLKQTHLQYSYLLTWKSGSADAMPLLLLLEYYNI